MYDFPTAINKTKTSYWCFPSQHGINAYLITPDLLYNFLKMKAEMFCCRLTSDRQTDRTAFRLGSSAASLGLN